MNSKKLSGYLFIPFIFLVFLPLGCSNKQQYRTGELSFADENCDVPYRAGPVLYPSNDEEVMGDYWRCYDQEHTLPGGAQYSLNFLEFNEDGELFDEKQFDRIRSRVSDDDTYLIVFVHGWRHDARQRDRDVRKFRTLLAYSAAFIDQRRTLGRYRNTKVVGLYVGWRGRSFAEPPDANWGIVGAWATVWGRKRVSENIASSVVARLGKIEDALGGKSPQRLQGFSKRMLVIGHSLGGNLLITGLTDDVVRSLETTHTAGEQFPSPLGDLTVLVNPAAEASKWTSIQKAVWALAGQGESRNLRGAHRIFPFRQRPVLISLTSSCNWAAGDETCDTATGTLFPLSRRVALASGRENIVALGHLDSPLDSEDELYRLGTTHEIDLNQSLKLNSSYENAASKTDSAGCAIVDGWLTEAKRRVGDNGVGWDAGIGEGIGTTPKNITPIRTNPPLESQFRHGIYLQKLKATAANDPFWNVRAHGSVINSHGSYVSYQMWCAVNQLVLDDPTAATYQALECTGESCKPFPK